MLLGGHAVTWLSGDGGRPRLSRLGEKRLGMFGSLPGRSGGSPVKCCLPLVLAYVAGPFSSCPPVHAGDTLVRLGRVAVGRFDPLGGGGQVLGGVPVSVPELLKPAANGIKPNNDLPLTAWRAPGLVVHASRHDCSSPGVLSDHAHSAGLGVARSPGVRACHCA